MRGSRYKCLECAENIRYTIPETMTSQHLETVKRRRGRPKKNQDRIKENASNSESLLENTEKNKNVQKTSHLDTGTSSVKQTEQLEGKLVNMEKYHYNSDEEKNVEHTSHIETPNVFNNSNFYGCNDLQSDYFDISEYIDLGSYV